MTAVTVATGPDLPPPAGSAGGGTTNDAVRRQNLVAVLSELRLNGTLSRAQLSAQTGLNRSTITGLVSELMDAALVRELPAVPSTGKAGRPISELQVDDAVSAISVGVDADGVTVALIGLGGTVHARLHHDTARPVSPRRFVQLAVDLINVMRADIDRHYRVVGVGLAVPGLVDARGSVLVAPTLQWRHEPIAARMSDRLGMHVTAGNDASIGALVETRFGVARGVRNLLYLGGSLRGIGGGVIMDGTLLRGTSGYAGELGHTVVNPGGIKCVCGRRGCLEAEVDLSLIEPLLGRRRLDEDELDVELGVARDPKVMAEVARQVDVLSIALTNFVNAFSPELVVLSGYLGSLLSVSRERLSAAVRLHPLGAEGRVVRLERSRLRSRLMLIGPAELAFAPILADPTVAPRR